MGNKNNRPRIIEGEDYCYFSDGTPLGICEDCKEETAYHFDENGTALCEDCLMENHENGLYDEPD